jgi:Protein of unknown function (DUF4054)
MILTYSSFVGNFPEFATLSEPQVQGMISQTEIEVNEYEGLSCEPETQQLAIALHVAHSLTIQSRQTAYGFAGPVKRLKSRNEEIEFGGDGLSSPSLQSTSYGQRLLSLLQKFQFMVRYCG